MNRIKQYKLDQQLYVSKQTTSKRNLFTSAYDVFIDFARDAPSCITLDASYDELETKLRMDKFGFLIVANSQGKFLGVIETERTIHNDFNPNTQNIVERFYTSADELSALDYRDIRIARALDILHTQKSNDRNFVLVVDAVLEEVRGIFTTHYFQKILSPGTKSFPHTSFSEFFRDRVKSKNSLLTD